jgi:dihydroorotase
MSKFLCMGVSLYEVVKASTLNAGLMLQRPEYGSLKAGSVGDATILSVREGKHEYVDVVGETLVGDRRIASEGVVLKGKWWHPKRSRKFAKAG